MKIDALKFLYVLLVALIVSFFFLRRAGKMNYEISAQKAFELVAGGALLVDVRESFEHDNGFVINSVHIPLGAFNAVTIPGNHQPVVFYCRSGRRSLLACDILKKIQPERECYSVIGGMAAWPDKRAIVQRSQ